LTYDLESLILNRVLEVVQVRYVFTQNSIKLSAAVRELSCY